MTYLYPDKKALLRAIEEVSKETLAAWDKRQTFRDLFFREIGKRNEQGFCVHGNCFYKENNDRPVLVVNVVYASADHEITDEEEFKQKRLKHPAVEVAKQKLVALGWIIHFCGTIDRKKNDSWAVVILARRDK